MDRSLQYENLHLMLFETEWAVMMKLINWGWSWKGRKKMKRVKDEWMARSLTKRCIPSVLSRVTSVLRLDVGGFVDNLWLRGKLPQGIEIVAWRGLIHASIFGIFVGMVVEGVAGSGVIGSSSLGGKSEDRLTYDGESIIFRAVVQLPDGVRIFSLHDVARDLVFWIESGQTRHGIEIVKFDPATNELTIRRGEDETILALASTRTRDAMEDLLDAGIGPRPSGIYTLGELSMAELEEFIAGFELHDELTEFARRWTTAIAELPEIREIEGRIVTLTEKGTAIMENLRAYERGSAAHQRLMKEGIRVGEEMTEITHWIEKILMEHSTFLEGDLELFRGRSSIGMDREKKVVTLSSMAGNYAVKVVWFARPPEGD